MKVLFICRGNIGRSQMAKAFYNQMHGEASAEACGTAVYQNDGQLISDIQDDGVEKDINVMTEVGLDISNYRRKHISIELINEAEKIVVMAEPDSWPEYLKERSNLIVWDVENPKGTSVENVRLIRDTIRRLIQQF